MREDAMTQMALAIYGLLIGVSDPDEVRRKWNQIPEQKRIDWTRQAVETVNAFRGAGNKPATF